MTKYNDADVKKASQKISELVAGAYDSLSEAQELADEYGLMFSFEPAYGMGGWYTGKGNPDWSESDADNSGDNESGYWMASSQSC